MNAESLLVLLFGMLTGGCLGYSHAWRFARKLELHKVVLAKWDQPMDLQGAPQQATIMPMARRAER